MSVNRASPSYVGPVPVCYWITPLPLGAPPDDNENQENGSTHCQHWTLHPIYDAYMSDLPNARLSRPAVGPARYRWPRRPPPPLFGLGRTRNPKEPSRLGRNPQLLSGEYSTLVCTVSTRRAAPPFSRPCLRHVRVALLALSRIAISFPSPRTHHTMFILIGCRCRCYPPFVLGLLATFPRCCARRRNATSHSLR